MTRTALASFAGAFLGAPLGLLAVALIGRFVSQRAAKPKTPAPVSGLRLVGGTNAAGDE